MSKGEYWVVSEGVSESEGTVSRKSLMISVFTVDCLLISLILVCVRVNSKSLLRLVEERQMLWNFL